MNRRDAVLVPLALGAAGLPVRGFAQTHNAGKPYRIALLPDLTAVGLPVALKVFTDTLSEAGRIEGRDFTLVQNRKIVRAMGLTVPHSVLVQATEVID